MGKPLLRIFLDERVDDIDERTCRVVFSAVEIPESMDLGMITIGIKSIGLAKNYKKLHFTDLSQADRHKIVRYISDLNIRVKIFTYYSFSETKEQAKRKALTWTIKKIRESMTKNTLEFKIEKAEEYTKTIKASNLTSDYSLTILPDAFCHVFARRLAPRDNPLKIGCKIFERMINLLLARRKKADLDNFNMLSGQIRLEGYLYTDGTPHYCQREHRIRNK